MSISTITINAIDYIAYASVAEADAYLAVDPVRGAAWDVLTDDQKGARLVSATRRLDLLAWAGEKTGGASQENAWPRTGVTYPDGTAVPDDEVPLEVENATILLAGTINLTASAANAGTSGNNKKRVKAGSAEVEYFRPTTGTQLQDDTAFALVRIFLGSQSAMTTASLGARATGTCEESSFSCPDMGYKLTDGYP